jgi:hypothetical protein
MNWYKITLAYKDYGYLISPEGKYYDVPPFGHDAMCQKFGFLNSDQACSQGWIRILTDTETKGSKPPQGCSCYSKSKPNKIQSEVLDLIFKTSICEYVTIEFPGLTCAMPAKFVGNKVRSHFKL